MQTKFSSYALRQVNFDGEMESLEQRKTWKLIIMHNETHGAKEISEGNQLSFKLIGTIYFFLCIFTDHQ